MSLLSKKIEEYILESGETVQSLAEMGNFNRTTLQRVKSGERLPTRAFFKKMTKVLRLSATEEAELETLLEIAQVGEGTYANRQKIIELIETISELTEYKIPFSKELRQKEVIENDGDFSKQIQIVSGKKQVLGMIENCIDRELFQEADPTVKLAIPYSFHSVYDYLFQQMMGNKKQLNLQDVLNLRRSFDDTVADPMLGALKHLIALTLLDNVNYQSHCYVYHSETKMTGPEISALFPYFILTTNAVITISRDLNQAVLYQDPGFRELYANCFQEMIASTRPFILESNDLFKVFDLDRKFKVEVIVEPLPCFAYYADRELLEITLNKDFPYYEPLLEAVDQYFTYFRQVSRGMLNIFSLKNLRQFMNDGSLVFPEEIYHPLTPVERLTTLKQVRDDLFHNRRILVALDDDKLFLNSAVEFIYESIDCLRLVLHYKINGRVVYKTIELREPGIIAAFADFFTSLPNSDYVLPTETTLLEMDALIRDYEPEVRGQTSPPLI
ncbi:MAG: helix-turn-helix transcriptional regulator [Acetobacterium woodii]|nr:helix-turn-helix transcriptional regulator [Acetobacterium woodii]